VGAIQKRKNISRLVEAFESVDPSWKLVLAGSAGYGSAEILARIERSPARGRIRVLGYVSAAELAAHYAGAEIFAFPSLDEGFGHAGTGGHGCRRGRHYFAHFGPV